MTVIHSLAALQTTAGDANTVAHASADHKTRLIHEIVRNLDEVAGIERVWKRGVVHSGGPHYRLAGTLGPVSLGEDECFVFGRLIELLQPANCFIIGNAFGMSSTFIAKMMEQHGGRAVVTLDSKSEGDGERCFSVAQQLAERMHCRILINKVGWSPRDVARVVEDDTYDLIFIDGDHSHPQATLDFEAVQYLAKEETVLCWHDYWLPGVPESVEAAHGAGYRCIKINTSCELVLGARSADVIERLRACFPNVEAPKKRRRPVAYLKLYQSLAVGAIRRRLR